MLKEKNWIPIVTKSSIEINDYAFIEEDIIVVFTVEILFDGYKRGVFGIPFFIIGNNKFWGIERIIPLIKKLVVS